MVFCVFIFIFIIETLVRENNSVGRTSITVIVIFFQKCHSESTSSQLCSNVFLNNYKAPWQQHLKDTVQLKILWTWINISINALVHQANVTEVDISAEIELWQRSISPDRSKRSIFIFDVYLYIYNINYFVFVRSCFIILVMDILIY